MTTTKTSTKPAKTFTRIIDGREVTFKRTASGYCFRDGVRISGDVFDSEKLGMYRDRNEEARVRRVRAALMRSQDPSREEYEDRRSEMNIIEIDGVEWAKDHVNRKTYRDGVECSRAEFNRAMGIGASDQERSKRKARRSADVAFEHGGVTLTSRQADFMRAMAEESSQGSPECGWYVDLLIDSSGISPMSAGAMVSTLREKGVIRVSCERREDAGRSRRVKVINLTDAGHEIWAAMGL